MCGKRDLVQTIAGLNLSGGGFAEFGGGKTRENPLVARVESLY